MVAIHADMTLHYALWKKKKREQNVRTIVEREAHQER